MGRINTAQRRLIESGFFSDGEIGTWFTRDDLATGSVVPALFNTFMKYGEEIEQALKANLEAEGKIASRSLIDSIRYNLYETGQTVTLELLLEPHYQYVNDGRIGKKKKKSVDKKRLVDPTVRGPKLPPFEPISKWVRYKGIKELSYPSLGYKTRQTNRVSGKLKKARLVDKIRWGIFNKGIEPTYFFKDVVNDSLIKQITDDMAKGVGRGVELVIST